MSRRRDGSRHPNRALVVHHVHKLVPFGDRGVGCNVYVGRHPSPQYTQQSVEVTPTRSAGTLFGEPVEWLTWSSRGRWTTEVLTRHPTTNEAVHVFGSTCDELELGELRRIASTLRPVRPAR